jgi:hypothetical protein
MTIRQAVTLFGADIVPPPVLAPIYHCAGAGDTRPETKKWASPEQFRKELLYSSRC